MGTGWLGPGWLGPGWLGPGRRAGKNGRMSEQPDVRQIATQLTRRLATAGAISVLGGAVAAASGSEGRRAFGQQTAGWGAIDLLIAGVSAARGGPAPAPAALRRILLINAALDVGYIAAGAHLAVRRPTLGGRLTPASAAGHGAAVVVQGALLLVLDTVFARRLSRAG
jgi:hypothetical protein